MVIQDIFRTRGDNRSDLTILWQREVSILSIYGMTITSIIFLFGLCAHELVQCLISGPLAIAFTAAFFFTLRAYKKEMEYQRTRPIDHSSDTDDYIDNY